jgi:hypothetical protein
MKHNGYIHSAGTEVAREAIAKHFGSEKAPLTKEVRIGLTYFTHTKQSIIYSNRFAFLIGCYNC